MVHGELLPHGPYRPTICGQSRWREDCSLDERLDRGGLDAGETLPGEFDAHYNSEGVIEEIAASIRFSLKLGKRRNNHGYTNATTLRFASRICCASRRRDRACRRICPMETT